MDQRQLQRQYDAFVRAPKYAANGSGGELYCVCRTEDNGELMVACDGCDEWFHFKCMKLDPKWKNLVKSYHCPFCTVLKGTAKPLWKRKCRLPDCYLSIADNSAFCSQNHGELYWKRVLSRFQSTSAVDYDQNERVYPGGMNTMFSLLNSKDQLDKLGDSLPSPPESCNGVTDALIEGYTSKIRSLNIEKVKLDQRKIILEAKKVYIMKLKDHISEVNKILNSSQTPHTNEDLKPKKKKSKSSKNSSKFDICGYDSHLDTQDWLNFVDSDGYKKFIGSSIEDENTIKNEYESIMKPEEGMEIDQESTSLKWICLNDKRKCIHSNWFTVERDDVISKIDIIVTNLEKIALDVQDFNKLIDIQRWEQHV